MNVHSNNNQQTPSPDNDQSDQTGDLYYVDNSKPLSRWRTIASTMRQQIQTDYKVPFFVFDPDSTALFYWVGAVSIATVYNTWMIALRMAFPEIRNELVPKYLDNFCDCAYLIDILVQFRTAYLHYGIPVFDPTKIRHQYAGSPYFLNDLLSVLPTETLLHYIVPDFYGINYFVLHMGAARLNRIFKVHVLYRFHDLAESRTRVPHFIRVFRLSTLLAIVIHWIACLYYFLSEYEGLGSTDWVYTGDPNQQRFLRKYIVCMYWSAMTLTTIGNTNNPETDLEYVFTGTIFLTGVFVFATVLGNVGDVISSMNANRQEFQARMDHITMYLTHKNAPASLQLKIKKWAEYSWSRTKATDEWRLFNILPERLRAEVAIHVHLDNLKKVKIFEQCETGFLCELVLKLRSQVYSPGDYICKVGETGREMFIINHGQVEVVVPNPSTLEETVVATLCEGNYFGEISLLRLDGVQNRRTADVRSIGYSELLCLSRKDLMTALVEYPEAKSALEVQAKKRMKTSLQAKRAFSVDALLRNSLESTSGNSGSREDVRGRDVAEIKMMIEELKNMNKVPGSSLWQLIARCELLQIKVQDKEREIEDFRKKIQELEDLLSARPQALRRERLKTITKQFSQLEGREDGTLFDCDHSITAVKPEDMVNGKSHSMPAIDISVNNGGPFHGNFQPFNSKNHRTFKTFKKTFRLKKSSTLLDGSDFPSLNSCPLVNSLDKRRRALIRAITEEESGESSSMIGSTAETLVTKYLERTASCVDSNAEEMIVADLENQSESRSDDLSPIRRRFSEDSLRSVDSRRFSNGTIRSRHDSSDSSFTSLNTSEDST